VVTAPADPHLALAALAVEQPVVVLEHRDPRRRGVDIRRGSRHKEAADPLTSSTATQKARGLCKRARAFAFLGDERSLAYDAGADLCAIPLTPAANTALSRPLPGAPPTPASHLARTECSNQEACGLVHESYGPARALRAVWTGRWTTSLLPTALSTLSSLSPTGSTGSATNLGKEDQGSPIPWITFRERMGSGSVSVKANSGNRCRGTSHA